MNCTPIPRRSSWRGALGLTLISVLRACAAAARAANVPAGGKGLVAASLKEVVINATPLGGSGVPLDDIPGNVQLISAAQLSRQGTASLTTALNTQISSININDNIADPFQPDILYRGFEASPVLGTPQGLAVYENGVRINEAFGDTATLVNVCTDAKEACWIYDGCAGGCSPKKVRPC